MGLMRRPLFNGHSESPRAYRLQRTPALVTPIQCPARHLVVPVLHTGSPYLDRRGRAVRPGLRCQPKTLRA